MRSYAESIRERPAGLGFHAGAYSMLFDALLRLLAREERREEGVTAKLGHS